jgi:anti-anti-sigma factor
VVTLRGDERGYVDPNRARVAGEQLREACAVGNPGNLVVDMGRVESCTADLLHLLMEVRRQVLAKRRRVAVCRVRPACANLLEAAGFSTTFECYGSLEEALESLAE